MDRSTSEDLFDRAVRAIPGGVNSPVRAFGSVGGTPPFLTRGAGAHVWDADGNRYIDLVQSWGPLPLGHAHPEVIAAARSAVDAGTTFGAPTPGEVELAEELAEAVPGLDQVRLVNSGTEAAMSALRLARGATGRARILKFAGHYHGHSDALLVDAGSGVATLSIPGSPGVTAGAAGDTVVVPWNDLHAVDAAVDQHGQDLAAIVCEPVAANMGLVPPADGLLEALRLRADRSGALLVFDEVITGFRLGRGGAQARYGVTPDLTVMGKAIGGGFPLAAFGGRQEVMAELAPAGPVYQAGTLSGNPVAVAAGLAQVRLLRDDVFVELERTTTRLVQGLRPALSDVGGSVRQLGTLAGVVFGAGEVRDYREARAADHDAYGRFFHAMLDRGVYLAPSGYEVMFTSTAHDDDTVDLVIAAAEDAAAELRTAADPLP
ncbi:MAG: glutamate-1-semialdehyde 2,1-aminomutase [Actinobacteria bacterium]|nr:glutamate-1-semialdehyde 2,1-aminomutase [Actinomycetota bacterium]